MTKATVDDLKELKELIITQNTQLVAIHQEMSRLSSQMETLENRMGNLENRMANLEMGQKRLTEGQQSLQYDMIEVKTKLNTLEPSIQKLPDLAEKVGELKNWRQIVIILITASVSGAVGWLIRDGNVRP